MNPALSAILRALQELHVPVSQGYLRPRTVIYYVIPYRTTRTHPEESIVLLLRSVVPARVSVDAPDTDISVLGSL